MKNDPGLCKLTEIALAGHIAAEELKERKEQQEIISDDDNKSYDKIIKRGKVAKLIVERYCAWSTSGNNPLCGPREVGEHGNWVKPDVDPRCKEFRDIFNLPDNWEEDYTNLVNTVNIHDCLNWYCLRTQKGLTKDGKK